LESPKTGDVWNSSPKKTGGFNLKNDGLHQIKHHHPNQIPTIGEKNPYNPFLFQSAPTTKKYKHVKKPHDKNSTLFHTFHMESKPHGSPTSMNALQAAQNKWAPIEFQ